MFFGSYEHTIDEKGRLVIPRKMRDELGGKIFIMKGFDGALSLQKEEVFMNLLKQFESLPFNIKNNRDYLRPQLASACELEIDKMGRVQIPTLLLTKYKIGKEVVVIGAGDHVEVWDKQTYIAYEEQAEANFETLAETITKVE
ncbi:MAG: division/cell wall cluster transcriptional repressor MraZ [Bacilli bacterium]|nr:division/cell wall cluster transcriptional repressor MraZ [Bacilli bacterium]